VALTAHQSVVPYWFVATYGSDAERFGDLEPCEHNLMSFPIAETVFETRVGEGWPIYLERDASVLA
jgi:hypothetical protein